MSLDIPESTKEAMWLFFLKTSVPRLIESKKKEAEKKEGENK